MKNTFLLCLASAASYAYAENLLDLTSSLEEAQIEAEEAAAEEEIVKLSCGDRITSVEQIAHKCYFKSDFYQAQDRDTKMNQAWSMLFEEDEVEDDGPIDIWWDKVPNFFLQKSNGSFCQSSDSSKASRPKVIHNQGLVAKVSWVPVANNGYTGIYETGSDHVLMRVSEAQNLTELSKGLTPSAAFKFFVDGMQSQNLLVQNSFSESDSWNFFEKPLANRVTPFNETDNPIEFKTVHLKLTESKNLPYGLAIGHIGDRYLNGDMIENREDVKIPYELRFHSPNKEAFAFADNSENWFDRLRDNLDFGDTIYEVYALTAPEHLGGAEVKIADVKLQTDLLASQEADEFLYFRHKNQLFDRKYWGKEGRPWLQYLNDSSRFDKNDEINWKEVVPQGVWPEDTDEAEAFYVDQVREFGCPFAWLLAEE